LGLVPVSGPQMGGSAALQTVSPAVDALQETELAPLVQVQLVFELRQCHQLLSPLVTTLP